jgi:hypothetical protein
MRVRHLAVAEANTVPHCHRCGAAFLEACSAIAEAVAIADDMRARLRGGFDVNPNAREWFRETANRWREAEETLASHPKHSN